MLLLKRHLVQLVREGKKRQTIRLWSRPFVHAGQISFTPGLGRMKILSVERVASLAALTEKDAHADGFINRAALLAEIENIYGKTSRLAPVKKTPRISATTTIAKPPRPRVLYRIRFQWPIDPAGKALVIGPAPPPPPAPRRKIRLAARLRHALRAFILSRAPRP